MPLTEINDAVDNGPVDDDVCRTLDGRRYSAAIHYKS